MILEGHRTQAKNIEPIVLENFSSFGQESMKWESEIKETNGTEDFSSLSLLSAKDIKKEGTTTGSKNSVKERSKTEGILTKAELRNWKFELETKEIDNKNNTLEPEKCSRSAEGTKSVLETTEQPALGVPEKYANIDSSRLANVFVPTSRKIISPVKTHQGTFPAVFSYVIDDVKSEVMCANANCKVSKHEEINRNGISSHISNKIKKNSKGLQKTESSSTEKENKKLKLHTKLETDKKSFTDMFQFPNLEKSFNKPNSKETSPSIKMIIAKYNQKILDRNGFGGNKNENDPPKKEKTEEKFEKYSKEDDSNDSSNVRGIKKCASYENSGTGVPEPGFKNSSKEEVYSKGITKSNSIETIQILPEKPECQSGHLLDVKDTPALEKIQKTSPCALRTLKIQKAKEDFLSGRLSVSSDASTRNAYQDSEFQVEKPDVDSNANFFLNKSISVEAMSSNNPSDEKEIFQCGKGLPKSPTKFDISSIKSKFRRIRMKKDKESKLSSVTALCRQSLLIDVPTISNANPEMNEASKSCPPSPVTDRRKATEKEKKTSFQNLDKNR